MRDLYHNLDAVTCLLPLARTATSTSETVDLQGYEGALVLFHLGTITDGTHTFELQESDTTTAGDFAAVAAADLQGTEPVGASDNDDKVISLGYIGSKQYLRVVCTVATATTGGTYGISVVKGFPRHN
jgi:hypothetical protein